MRPPIAFDVPWPTRGTASAQNNLGFMDNNGQGAPQDNATAVSRRRRKAADQGDADAQYSLASLYDTGLGVPQDYAAAASWLRKAADQGTPLLSTISV